MEQVKRPEVPKEYRDVKNPTRAVEVTALVVGKWKLEENGIELSEWKHIIWFAGTQEGKRRERILRGRCGGAVF